MTDSHPVARYYDRNTRRFLRFGRIRGSGVIHRALWAPGVTTTREAGSWIHEWIEGRLVDHGFPGDGLLLDLGCGVGGTLVALARAFPRAEFHGVTISPHQVELARQFVEAGERRGDGGGPGAQGPDAGPGPVEERGPSRIRIHQGDFEDLHLPIRAHAAVAVEAFVHARDAGAFFRSAASHLLPGGLLVVVDDVLARPRGELAAGVQRRIRDFEAGWRLGSLGTVDDVEDAAREAGFRWVAGFDFTPWTRPGRPRDRVIALLAPMFRGVGLVRSPFFANMIGGDALQEGLGDGFIRYRGLVLRRTESAGGPLPPLI